MAENIKQIVDELKAETVEKPITTLTLVKYPDPLLLGVCSEIDAFDENLRHLSDQMLRLMKTLDGVGLAGPQVGVQKRIFVCNHTGNPGDDQVYINPLLTELSEESVGMAEGCLSVPGVSVVVSRSLKCKMIAQNINGDVVVLEGEGLVARIWQHEIDHLDGRLILDYQ